MALTSCQTALIHPSNAQMPAKKPATVTSESNWPENSQPVATVPTVTKIQTQAAKKSSRLKIRCPQEGDTLLAPKPLRGRFYRPLIVGHQGAPGYAPEETAKSYRLALQMGADYIEPDLVMSKDGVLIVRHENNLSETTNASQVYPNLIKTKIIDGVTETGVFSEDLTLTQIKKLRCNKGPYHVLTFEDYLRLAREESRKLHRPVGLIPEIKDSTYFHKLGFDPEMALVRLLNEYHYNNYFAPVIIQSTEVSDLKRLHNMVRDQLMQILGPPNESPADVVANGGTLTYGEMATPKGLRSIAQYAAWVAPEKNYIIPLTLKSKTIPPATNFVYEAHIAGLEVMPWTFRANDALVRKFYGGKEDNEYNRFFALGIDGLFTDYPDLAVKFRARYLAKCNDVHAKRSVSTDRR